MASRRRLAPPAKRTGGPSRPGRSIAVNLGARFIVGGMLAATLISIAGCSSSSSTTAPAASAAASSGTGASAAPSVAASQAASAAASQGAGGGAGAPDAATFLTADAASSLLGAGATKVPYAGQPGMPVSVAAYTTAAGDSMTVYIQQIPGQVAAAQLQAAIAAQGIGGQLQSVAGIGDSAGKVIDTNEATVVFSKGSSLVVIDAKIGSSTGDAIESKLESLAKQIAGKL
jgi:hypothetical protein